MYIFVNIKSIFKSLKIVFVGAKVSLRLVKNSNKEKILNKRGPLWDICCSHIIPNLVPGRYTFFLTLLARNYLFSGRSKRHLSRVNSLNATLHYCFFTYPDVMATRQFSCNILSNRKREICQYTPRCERIGHRSESDNFAFFVNCVKYHDILYLTLLASNVGFMRSHKLHSNNVVWTILHRHTWQDHPATIFETRFLK